MIVIVSSGRSILGADNAAVASLSSPTAADWINQVHPDDRLAATHVLDRSRCEPRRDAVIRSWWPRIGYRRTRCAAVTIGDFVLLRAARSRPCRCHPFKEMEVVIVAAACPEEDEQLGEKLDPIYSSMLVGVLRAHLSGLPHEPRCGRDGPQS